VTGGARGVATTDTDGGGTERDEVRARVLIVDDEPAIARGLARILSHAGHAVTSAMSGEEAVALFESQRFDVILSDIRMPRMDGLTLLRAIRAKDPDVPVAFMTGDPAAETAVEAMEHGAFGYLLKPVDIAEVVAVVERAARLYRLARARREAADAL
jgi:DNA-binding NtrC family response regulator